MLTMQASKGLNMNYVGILISPNPGCTKINLVNFFCNTLALALAKFFPAENFPLYGMKVSISVSIMMLRDVQLRNGARRMKVRIQFEA